jgi:hypothetical protein
MKNLDVINTKTCKSCNETKDISKFEKNRYKCRWCRTNISSKREKETLPDYYIKKILKKESLKKNIIFICSEKIIISRRFQIIKERAIREYDLLLMNTINSRKCKICNQIKSLNYFKDGKKHKRSCYICRNSLPINLKRKEKYREILIDCIVKGNIMGMVNRNLEKNLRIKASEIPQEFIELKRKELTLKRKIKNENKQRSS